MSLAALHEHGLGRKLDAFGSFPEEASHHDDDTVTSVAMEMVDVSSGSGTEDNINEVHSPASSSHSALEWNSDDARDHGDQLNPVQTSPPTAEDDNQSYQKDTNNDEKSENSTKIVFDSQHPIISPACDREEESLVICEDAEYRENTFIPIREEQHPTSHQIKLENPVYLVSEDDNSLGNPDFRRSYSTEELRRDGDRISSPVENIKQEYSPIEDGEKTVVKLEGFSHYFTHNLYTLQHRQLFCDVAIKTKSKVIYAHKVVLAACSPYFYNVLQRKQSSADLKESNEKNGLIDMDTMSTNGLESVIDCMYSSRVTLRHSTVHEILQTATFLSMQLVVDACFKYLHSEHEEQYKKTLNEQRSATVVISPGKNETANDVAINLSASSSATRLQEWNNSEQYESQTIREESARKTDLSRCDAEKSARNPENTRTFPQRNSSPQDVKVIKPISPKSINWKKYKYITQNAQNVSKEEKYETDSEIRNPRLSAEERKTEIEQPNITTSSNGACLTDDDDDVFERKMTSRKPSLSGDSSHSLAMQQDNLAGINHLAVDLIRRHQRDVYNKAMTHSPYMLTPEAMAAAMTMTSLTSNLQSPTASQFIARANAEQTRFAMNPWEHILGQRFNHALSDESRHLLASQFNPFPVEPRKQHPSPVEEQNFRQHPLFLAGSTNRFAPQPFNPLVRPEVDRRISGEDKKYNPLLLKSLLQKNENDSLSQSLKRSYSNASTESNESPTHSSLKRFSMNLPYFTDGPDSKRFNADTQKYEVTNHQPKQRKSTASSSGSPDRPYKCMVCAAEFNRPANLKTHMRIHSGEKPYKCQSCGARFVQIAHLRAHILIHTGEKPYPCKVCGTRFRHLQTLKSHMRIHTGEKPYACDECKVRFRHKSQLRLHLRTKHGIHTNTKKTYQQIPGLRSADICAHIKRTQEAVRMQALNSQTKSIK